MSTMFEQLLDKKVRNPKLDKFFNLLDDHLESDDYEKEMGAMKLISGMESRYITSQKNMAGRQSSIFIQDLSIDAITHRIESSHKKLLVIEEENG